VAAPGWCRQHSFPSPCASETFRLRSRESKSQESENRSQNTWTASFISNGDLPTSQLSTYFFKSFPIINIPASLGENRSQKAEEQKPEARSQWSECPKQAGVISNRGFSKPDLPR
jgi:hypothetical protein